MLFRDSFWLHPLGRLGLLSCFSVSLSDHASDIFLFIGVSSTTFHGPRMLFCPLFVAGTPFSSSPGRQCLVHSGVLHLSTWYGVLQPLSAPVYFSTVPAACNFYQLLPMCVSNPLQRRQNYVFLLTFIIHHR